MKELKKISTEKIPAHINKVKELQEKVQSNETKIKNDMEKFKNFEQEIGKSLELIDFDIKKNQMTLLEQYDESSNQVDAYKIEVNKNIKTIRNLKEVISDKLSQLGNHCIFMIY